MQTTDNKIDHKGADFEQASLTMEDAPIRPRSVAPKISPPKTRNASGIAWMLAAAFLVGSVSGIAWERSRQRQSPTVLAVNGAPITQSMLFERMQAENGAATAQQLIQDELQLQYAQSLKVEPTDAQVDATMSKLQKAPGFEDKLLLSAQTLTDYKWRLKVRMAEAAVMGQGITVTEADMKRFYQEQIDPSNTDDAYYTPATCNVAVIITSDADTAAKAYQSLQIGKPFDVVARQYSQDTSSTNGGLLPTLIYGRGHIAVVPSMQDTFFSLRIGQLMPPRKFAGAWWIVRCMSKSAPHTDAYSDVKDDCRLGALFEKGQTQHGASVNADFAQFARAGHTQAFWPQYNEFNSQ